MKITNKILIVGAGPAGLSAALFLSEKGIKPRIIDKKQKLSQFSKALGVNPRTLELFESSGLTKRFLENGRKMEQINIWKKDEHIYQNDLSKINHRYPFMLILPQNESEAILLEALSNRKIEVDFETELKTVHISKDKLNGMLSTSLGLLKEEEYSLLIGADGARSEVRKQVGIKLTGFQYEEEWELFDVELDTPLASDEGHIRLFKEGGMIMIRLKDNIWRLAGNLKPLLNYLPKSTKVGEIAWESKFRISHRVAEHLVKDNVILIGDAAHLHSPVGARGMNLGVEDAYLACNLLAENRIEAYTGIRQAFLKRTVSRINGMTQALAGNNFLSRNLRANIDLLSVIFPIVMPTARKFIMGLNK